MDLPTPPTRSGPHPPNWVSVSACSLPTAEQPLRVAAFDGLFAESLRSVEVPSGAGTRARLVLAGGADLPARVQRLADAETACCSFFTFTLGPLDTQPAGAAADETALALDVEVPTTRTDVLAALVLRAEQVRRRNG